MEDGSEGTTMMIRVPLVEGHRRRSGGGRGATASQTVGNILVSILGTGALGVPYVFRVAGWLTASLSLLLAAVSVGYCMLLLVKCRRKLEDEEEEGDGEADGSTQIAQTFSDVGAKAFGAGGRGLTDILILTSHAGGSVAYLVFMGQNLSTVASVYLTRVTTTTFSPSVLIVAFLLPVETAFSLVRSLSFLAPFSAFATLCNVFAMLAVVREDIMQLSTLGGSGGGRSGSSTSRRSAYNGAATVPFACGVALFCLEGLGMTLPLEGSMAERRRFPLVLVPALLGIVVAYVCFGAFGYMAYGEATQEIITLNLQDNCSALIVKVGLCAALAFTFPIAVHPIHEIVESNLKSSRWFQKLCDNSQGRQWLACQAARAAVVATLALLATSVPGFARLMSFSGSTVCALLSLVLPASFHLKLMGPSLALWQRAVDYFLLLVGLAFALFSTCVAILGGSSSSPHGLPMELNTTSLG